MSHKNNSRSRKGCVISEPLSPVLAGVAFFILMIATAWGASVPAGNNGGNGASVSIVEGGASTIQLVHGSVVGPAEYVAGYEIRVAVDDMSVEPE